MNKELMKGSTVVMILSLLDRKDMYGYEMTKEMERSSDGVFTLKEGTLYPILHGLEAQGAVEAYWSEAEGRKRKYYRITDQGRMQYADKKKEWQVFRKTVDVVLGEGRA